MVSPTFLAEVRRFCQTTSVRGVPRIMNSKSTLQSIIWTLGVLTCASLLVWQVVVIFNRYFAYQVSTVLVQSADWENTTFPDITICNLNPLIYENKVSLNYTDYITELLYQTNNHFGPFQKLYASYMHANRTDLLEAAYKETLQYLAIPVWYLSNFPFRNLFGTNQLANPMLDCSYFDWEDTPIADSHCVASHSQQRWNPDFYSCYTLTLNDSVRKNVRGFSAVVYVEDNFGILFTKYQLDLVNTHATGMQVLVHAPGTAPDMNYGVPVRPGLSTTITIDQTVVRHLPYPFSNCTTQKYIEDIDHNTTYTKGYCADVCVQQHCLESCGCIANFWHATDRQLYQANYSICGNISLNGENSSLNWNGVKQTVCAGAAKQYQASCKHKCLAPCEEYQYRSSVSSASWPQISAQFSFYSRYLQLSARFRKEFDIFNTILWWNAFNTTQVAYHLKKTDQEGLLKNRFLQLNVKFDTPSFLKQKDVATFSFDAFGAQIGGTLSMWLGVTIILVFELCEFVINLTVSRFRSRRNAQPSSKEIMDTRL